MGKKLPEARGILLAVLLSDILNTIIRESASLSSLGSTGKTTLILYIIHTVIMYVTFTVIDVAYLARYLSELQNDESVGAHVLIKICLLAVETVGAILYFYGDNISIIFQQHGDELGCGQRCVENIRISAAIFLGLALICYLFAPGLRMLTKILGFKTKITGVHPTFDMIAVFPKIDTVYTAMVTAAQTDVFCSTTEKSISKAFIALCILAGVGLMGFYCSIAMKKIHSDDGHNWNHLIPLPFLLLLVICFPLYMLADNSQPLDCEFGCDSFATNRTLDLLGCNAVGKSGLRLGFSLVTLIVAVIFTIAIVCMYICYNPTDKKQAREM